VLRERGLTQRTRDGSRAVAVTTHGEAAAIDEATVAAGIARALEPAPDGWLPAWRDADARARRAIDDVMDAWDEPFEPRIARDVAAAVPVGGTLIVGNSTPIRDLDLTMVPRDGLRVIANRGASGIDGLVSTAIGAASGSRGPTTAVVGDLSSLHDLGAVAWNARRIDVDLALVVVDNGGGEIFSFLPQRELPEHRRLFVTPHELDLAAMCEGLRLPYARVEHAAEVRKAVASELAASALRIVHVETSPRVDRDRRIELARAVDDALG
jgi:2-succinyl-5-enolpyruvyl-6-hydroxy-3-cyclohexene-1-carboxylate synthase